MRAANSNSYGGLEFAARIRQTEVFAGRDYQKVVKTLKRMAKSQKNQEYLDQVYYALGNVYLNRADTTNAITYYQLGIDSSKQNGMDKALCQIKLGDLYFQMRDYIHAQPCFSGALAGIQKEYKDYPRVSKLSAVLDELVVHAEAVHQQDSLQALAKMPEAERLAVIDKAIADLIKQEEEEKKQAEKEAYLADQEAKGTGIDRPGTETNAIVLPTGSNGSSFYFYNPQTVAQGKTQFQKKWGRRTLEDNWRRKKKELSTFNDPADSEMADAATEADLGAEGQALPTDSLESGMDPVAADDPHQREYYLQQLPFTQEDIDASNVIIIDGLYNMAMIYKDKLEDLSLSVEGFEELERRFPDNEHLLESYYQVYLIALRTHDEALAATYKQKLIDKFADSDYAVAIADPNYEYNIRMMDAVQDSIYEQTYTAYLADDTTLVRRNYQQVNEKYPLADLLPKFMFLEALTYVQAGDPEGFKAALKALLEKYPKADVSELAGEMLKGVLRGRAMVQGGVRGMSWDLRFGVGEDGSLSAADSARVFTAEPNTPYKLLLMYPAGSVDKNQLLFAVAAYNFANFMVKEFDLTFQTAGPIEMLQVSGFVNFDEILHYYKLIYGPDGYASALDRAISVLPISDDNYETLMHGKTLDEYITFFAEQFGDLAPELVARWQARMEEEAAPESVPEETDMSEPQADTVDPVSETEVVPAVEALQPALEPIQPDTVPQVADTLPVRKDLVIPAELIEGVKPDTLPVVEQPQGDLGLSLKEIQEIRKRQAAEEEARKEEARKAFEEQQQAEKALQAQKAQDLEDERKRQAEQEKALLQAKADREKQLAQDRKAKLKQAEADRKAKMKAREQLRKEKEKAYKAKLKQKEKERKAKEKAYKEKLKERERTRKRK